MHLKLLKQLFKITFVCIFLRANINKINSYLKLISKNTNFLTSSLYYKDLYYKYFFQNLKKCKDLMQNA